MASSDDLDTQDVEGIMGGLLKLGNEAGGRINRRRIEARPYGSYVRRALLMATDRGLVSRTGAITPDGYRWLGDWLESDGEAS